MSIGSETDGGVRNVLVESLTMDGATSGLRIKSDISRGGHVSNIRYRDVCLTNIRAPLDIDTRYDKKATGNKIPVYRDIAFERVRSTTPGRITLRGYNATHPLVATLNDVVIDGNPTVQVEHAKLTLGPGPVQPRLTGDGAEISGTPSAGAGKSCDGLFVPFPVLPAQSKTTRPQLSASEAEKYAYAEVLKTTGRAGSETADPWDPFSDPLATGANLKPDYVVDATATAIGKTVFNSVQAAVNHAVSEQSISGSKNRVYILVKPGTYRELLYVPATGAPITLYGSEANAANTKITANLDALVTGQKYAQAFGKQFVSAPADIKAMFDSLKDRGTISTSGSAVAWIKGEGFQARNITFENSYNKVEPGATRAGDAPVVGSQAVAMMVDDADKVQFENVRFLGLQDTLYLKSSSPARTARVFFNKSYVEGDVDFIFGDATAYFYQSEIKSLGSRRISYVTAPSTQVQSKFGFVFNTCKFTHDGSANALVGNFKLGRQWFRSQRCTPYGSVTTPQGYQCRLGDADRYDAPVGTISKGVLETVGKVIILNSQIGAHIDKANPWSEWNASGTIKHRPVQYSSDDFWQNLVSAGIDPVRQMGLAAKRNPPDPFLAEFKNTDE
jgi:polygalacturonase